MKNFLKLGLFLLFLISFFSCTNSIPAVNENLGYILVKIPEITTKVSRGLMSSSEASKIVNHYSIYCWSNSGILYNEDSSDYDGSIPKMPLPEGTYKLLVLAGYESRFLGLGYCNNIIIENDKITETEVSLNPISYETSLVDMKDSYEQGEQIKLSYTCELRGVPIILYAGAYHIYEKTGGMLYSYSNTAYPLNKNALSREYTISLPNDIGDYYITTSTDISIDDDWINEPSLIYGKSKHLWKLYIDDCFPENFNANFRKDFKITQKNSGLLVTIKWS